MAENSKIEWTDHTFNPWMGCTKVSPGCANCYAEAHMDTRLKRVEWGPRGTRVKTSPANWKQPLKWNREAEKAGTRLKVFCASLADVFEDRPELDPWRKELWGLIDDTPHLNWLILTKRPQNIAGLLPGCFNNVWLGTSVENQEQAEKRIPVLLNHRGRVPVLFLSCEPLLGPLNLLPFLVTHISVDWVIVGGESGKGARPINAGWVRAIRDQCQSQDVDFFFKQWGGVNKKESGRLLDSREWSEMPGGIEQ